MLELEWRGQRQVTTDQLKQLLGGSDNHARVLTHRLVRKGWLEPIKRGVFLVVPADRGPEGIPEMNPLVAGAQLAPEYFFSYGTACSYHHLTEQVFMTVFVACRRPPTTRIVRGTEYVLVRVPDDRFFGFDPVDVLGAKVNMATFERTLLDAVDKPQYAGGIGEVSRIVRNAAPRVSWPTLLEHARRWHESALVQRLGYLLDRHQADLDRTVRSELHGMVRPTNRIFLGARSRWGTSGKLDIDWNIIENVPANVLVDPAEAKRRTWALPKRESP